MDQVSIERGIINRRGRVWMGRSNQWIEYLPRNNTKAGQIIRILQERCFQRHNSSLRAKFVRTHRSQGHHLREILLPSSNKTIITILRSNNSSSSSKLCSHLWLLSEMVEWLVKMPESHLQIRRISSRYMLISMVCESYKCRRALATLSHLLLQTTVRTSSGPWVVEIIISMNSSIILGAIANSRLQCSIISALAHTQARDRMEFQQALPLSLCKAL